MNSTKGVHDRGGAQNGPVNSMGMGGGVTDRGMRIAVAVGSADFSFSFAKTRYVVGSGVVQISVIVPQLISFVKPAGKYD